MFGMSKICLITEGTYPISIGGVSKWIHTIVSNMPNVEFEIISLVPDNNLKFQYNLPSNVKKIHFWPIWQDKEFNGEKKGKSANDNTTVKKHKQYFRSEINTFKSSN